MVQSEGPVVEIDAKEASMSRHAFSNLRVIFLPLLVGMLVLSGCQWFKPNSGWTGQQNEPQDTVAVFFSKYQGGKATVAPVKRQVPEPLQTDPLPFAVEELLKGPTAEEKRQGFYSEIPAGTKLLGVKVTKEQIVVDLSKQFETGGGSNSMEQRLDELKNTVYAVDHQHQLAVSVEGKPLEVLGGEGLEVPETVKRQVH
jgi:spore germination protein GerM